MRSASLALTLTLMLLTAHGLAAQDSGDPPEPVEVDGLSFSSWAEYTSSEYFEAAGKRCATPEREIRKLLFSEPGFSPKAAADCTSSSTNPTGSYDPGDVYEIPVVVHIIMNDNGSQGAISDELVDSQIAILNEDFRAIAGTNGAPGFDTGIQFRLATTDPFGNPTTGITRSQNNTWFNDGGNYWNTLAWDPNRYLNIYTNRASGALGYVPFLPSDGGGGSVGTSGDRVVILWTAFGRDAQIGPPFDQGRTATHEVGHYLGLEHTFAASNSCPSGTPSACYSNGDLICDTATEQSPTSGCPANKTSCSSPDPVDNYLDYSSDLCMERFTQEQSRRMRCALTAYRSDLFDVVTPIFTDGFELGNTSRWSGEVP